MHLSRSQSRFGTLLLLPSLLLWGNVAAVPECMTEDGRCVQLLKNLFNTGIAQAEKLQALSSELLSDFFTSDFSSKQFHELTIRYLKKERVVENARSTCHTSVLLPPIDAFEASQLKTRQFMRLLMRMVGGWSSPLQHLMREVSFIPGAPENIVSKLREIKDVNDDLLLDIERIFLKIHPKGKPKLDYPAWTDFASLASRDMQRKFLIIYKMSYCLTEDAKNLPMFLNVIKCRVLRNTDGC